jgi:NAD(P)-dependent dehydrogenase (short-subunit alcohol dehydrogenase family)
MLGACGRRVHTGAFQEIMDVNFNGAFYTAQAAARFSSARVLEMWYSQLPSAQLW